MKHIQRRKITKWWKDFGYEPVFETREFQYLCKTTSILGIIYTRHLDVEEIPQWSCIELGAIGMTSWRSKFAEYIDADKLRGPHRLSPK